MFVDAGSQPLHSRLDFLADLPDRQHYYPCPDAFCPVPYLLLTTYVNVSSQPPYTPDTCLDSRAH